MSHALESQTLPFEELSQEEQIVYIEMHLEEIVIELRSNPMLEPWEAEMLADRLSRYRSQVEGGIDWEVLREEFLKD